MSETVLIVTNTAGCKMLIKLMTRRPRNSR